MAVALIVSFGVISCTKNDDTNDSALGNSKVSSYLKSFYKTNYQLGKSVDTKLKNDSPNSALSKSAEVEDFVVTEVLVGNDTTARGYVLTRKSDNEFVYFIDVNRIDYKMTTIKVDVNETMIFNNIDELDKYTSTNEFDLIKVAEQVNTGIISNFKFWGWGPWQYTDCVGGKKNAIRIYHVFWLSADYETQMGIPCDKELNPTTTTQ